LRQRKLLERKVTIDSTFKEALCELIAACTGKLDVDDSHCGEGGNGLGGIMDPLVSTDGNLVPTNNHM
jgi:hypothetical protein